MRIGVLFIQIGTPDRSSYTEVARFLWKFLMDWRVIQILWPLRAILVFLIISLRLNRVVHAYRSIWQEKGSPLAMIENDFCKKIREKNPHIPIEFGRNYSSPSIEKAITLLLQKPVDTLLIIPLSPQYASCTNGSMIARCYETAAKRLDPPALIVKREFYNDARWIDCLVQSILNKYSEDIDLIVLSFHGIPLSQLERSGHCEPQKCQMNGRCHKNSAERFFQCYRAQCTTTADLIFEKLKLRCQTAIVFQSKVGRLEWTRPSLEESISSWVTQGHRHILIATPSFVADCIETLEEIDQRFQEDWHRACPSGTVTVVRPLNTNTDWIELVNDWISEIQCMTTSTQSSPKMNEFEKILAESPHHAE